MGRLSCVVAIGPLPVFLAAAAFGQAGKFGPVAPEPTAPPVRAADPVAIPEGGGSAGPIGPGPGWNLGDYGPVPRYAADDLYPPGQTVGWYGEFDIGIMKPNLRTRLTTPAGFATPTGNPITLPTATLDWAGVPQFNLGYRLGQGAGELRLGYRLLASSGHDDLPGLDPPVPARLRTRLDVQTVDLDYISPEYLPDGGHVSRFFFRDLRAGFGLRVATAFFDSRAAGIRLTDTHVSSHFAGVGPRIFVELHQDLGRPDVQFYGQLTANGVVGPVRQRFSQTALTAGGADAAFFDTNNRNTGTGILSAEAGLSWEPLPLDRRLRLTAAYSWERWWNFGRTDDSNAELTLQGVLLRAEFRY